MLVSTSRCYRQVLIKATFEGCCPRVAGKAMNHTNQQCLTQLLLECLGAEAFFSFAPWEACDHDGPYIINLMFLRYAKVRKDM